MQMPYMLKYDFQHLILKVINQCFIDFNLLLNMFSIFKQIIYIPPTIPSSFPLKYLQKINKCILMP